MAKLRDLPGWAQVILAAVGMLVAGLLAFGDVKSDLRAETIERKAADKSFEDSIIRIEKMLKDEMDRHHPRQ